MAGALRRSSSPRRATAPTRWARRCETALCLKFLDSGSDVVVGSTEDLLRLGHAAADRRRLLGRSFWDNLPAGLPAGEALRRAKTLTWPPRWSSRQGYLDGEDQKTLISFVLYGDPLFMLTPARVPLTGKVIVRRTTRPAEIKTACALSDGCVSGWHAARRRFRRTCARHRLPTTCPGCLTPMPASTASTADAPARVTPARRLRSDRSRSGQADAGTTVVTLSKAVADGTHRHAKYARLTLDPSREGAEAGRLQVATIWHPSCIMAITQGIRRDGHESSWLPLLP